jgi:hypothetical protein
MSDGSAPERLSMTTWLRFAKEVPNEYLYFCPNARFIIQT